MVKRGIKCLTVFAILCAVSLTLYCFAVLSEAESGDINAINEVANTYQLLAELSERMDIYEKAVYWHKKAAVVGYCPAYIELFWLMRRQGRNSDAMHFLNAAAKYEYVHAQLILAQAYGDGTLGLSRNPVVAKEWAEKLRNNQHKPEEGRLFCK